MKDLASVVTAVRTALFALVPLIAGVLALLLRRRTTQLQRAQVDLLEAKQDRQIDAKKQVVASLEAEVDADDKKRLEAKARLDALLRGPSDDSSR